MKKLQTAKCFIESPVTADFFAACGYEEKTVAGIEPNSGHPCVLSCNIAKNMVVNEIVNLYGDLCHYDSYVNVTKNFPNNNLRSVFVSEVEKANMRIAQSFLIRGSYMFHNELSVLADKKTDFMNPVTRIRFQETKEI
ncbi:MAG: hypothetical protein FWF95_05165 [Syntrophorhabdaceae bacterium]|nr:hypothetical protein [Syntrophorhabdaceae bacterium]